MIYVVVSVPDENTVAIWDGVTRTDEGYGPATINLTVPNHGFEVNDRVSLAVRKEKKQEQE
jgi:hypothetical protein